MSQGVWIAIAVVAALLVVTALVLGLLRYRRRRIRLSSRHRTRAIDRSGGYTASSGITFTQSAPAEPVGSTPPAYPPSAMTPRSPAMRRGARSPTCNCPSRRRGATAPAPERPPEPAAAEPPPVVDEPAPPVVEAPAPALDEIAPTEGRLERLRGRLAKSQNTLGRSMLGLLGGGDLDESSWEEVEDTLLIADLGPVATANRWSRRCARRMGSSQDVRTEADARAVLREVLIEERTARTGPLDQGAAARRQAFGAVGRRSERHG